MHIADIFDDVDDSYWANYTLLREIVDEHSSQKQKYPKEETPPFMNSELRRAIYKKKLLFYKGFNRYKEKTNWEINRKQRIYEGCQESSWTPMIKASNEPDFDIHYYISLK